MAPRSSIVQSCSATKHIFAKEKQAFNLFFGIKQRFLSCMQDTNGGLTGGASR